MISEPKKLFPTSYVGDCLKIGLNAYLEKYAFRRRWIDVAPEPGLGIVVVLPAYDEPNIHHALNALHQCERPKCDVEVIVVVNQPENAGPEVKSRNEQTFAEVLSWQNRREEGFRVFGIFERWLPEKHAGVGLARKIGMDEAVRRFELAGHVGIIACFDADATCSSNYLTALEDHFKRHPITPGCSIRFEHPVFGTEFEPHVYLGAAYYELHLRYYNQALRSTGFPAAYHTVGSSMAVRTEAYQKQGGMNRRQAGEDFYFLHKIIALGDFTELHSAVVYPSPRPSRRVPFGTGKAINEYLKNPRKGFYTYNLRGFEYLRVFFKNVPEFYMSSPPLVTLGGAIPYVLIDFLNAYFFDERIAEIKANSKGFSSFEKRFFRWFNAFMVLKFVHFVRDNAHPNTRVEVAALQFLRKVNHPEADQIRTVNELLEVYRELDRKPIPAQVLFS